LNKNWLFLLVAVLASLNAAYLGWVYLSLLPLFIIAVLNMLKKSSIPFSADQSAQNQFLTEMAGLIHECEYNLSHISTTQKEAMSMLNSACKKLSVLQSITDQSIDNPSNQDNMAAHIATIIGEIIRGLQFDDVNQQNLAFTSETLSFVRGLISELALHGNDSFDNKVIEQLTRIHSRQSQKLNPVASTNLKAGDVDIF
jgi:methyl-accepting chemotaxis protein